MGKFEILNTHNLLRPKFAPVSVGKLLLAAPLTFLTHNIAAQFLDVSMWCTEELDSELLSHWQKVKSVRAVSDYSTVATNNQTSATCSPLS